MQNTFNFKLLKNLKDITINKIQIFKHDILKKTDITRRSNC